MSLYKEIEQDFAALKEVFDNGRKEPFNYISIRRPFDGSLVPAFRTLLEIHRGVVPRLVQMPDETDYVAVIELSHCGFNVRNKQVSPYRFKIRKDGAILRHVPFEYDKQPIEKWIKYIQNWMWNSSVLSEMRCRNRCFAVKEELISKMWASKFSD